MNATVHEDHAGTEYALTCLQFYLSILGLRLWHLSLIYAFNPDKYLNSHFNFMDSLVVLPFVVHIFFLLRTPRLANGMWLLFPAVLGVLTSVGGVVLLDRRNSHLIPALNVVFAGSLCLAHTRECRIRRMATYTREFVPVRTSESYKATGRSGEDGKGYEVFIFDCQKEHHFGGQQPEAAEAVKKAVI